LTYFIYDIKGKRYDKLIIKRHTVVTSERWREWHELRRMHCSQTLNAKSKLSAEIWRSSESRCWWRV